MGNIKLHTLQSRLYHHHITNNQQSHQPGIYELIFIKFAFSIPYVGQEFLIENKWDSQVRKLISPSIQYTYDCDHYGDFYAEIRIVIIMLMIDYLLFSGLKDTLIFSSLHDSAVHHPPGYNTNKVSCRGRKTETEQKNRAKSCECVFLVENGCYVCACTGSVGFQ